MTTAGEVPPDTKDWTWVLDRPCPECGLDAGSIHPGDLPHLLRANAQVWLALMGDPEVAVRPEPHVWSPLEYACHVRDVFRLFDTRLHLMLDTDGAQFANWDQDETAIADDYGAQDPAVVSDELASAADVLADSFAAVPEALHGNTGLRSDGSRFTVTTFAQYLVHDPVHHVWDVTGETAEAQLAPSS